MNEGVVDHLERALQEQRAANAAGYDREQALVELRALALDVAVAQNRHDITPERLWASAKTPEQRARVQSLCDRALSHEQTTPEVPA